MVSPGPSSPAPSNAVARQDDIEQSSEVLDRPPPSAGRVQGPAVHARRSSAAPSHQHRAATCRPQAGRQLGGHQGSSRPVSFGLVTARVAMREPILLNRTAWAGGPAAGTVTGCRRPIVFRDVASTPPPVVNTAEGRDAHKRTFDRAARTDGGRRGSTQIDGSGCDHGVPERASHPVGGYPSGAVRAQAITADPVR